MGQDTKISWATHTFNAWWGCTRVSEGCRNCYADTFAHRLGKKVWGPTAGRQPMSDKYWGQLDRWERDAAAAGARVGDVRVFCCSMADVFEGPETCHSPEAYAVVQDGRRRLFEAIERTPHLTYLLLTKRPENFARFAPESWMSCGWPDNAWPMTTCENQENADKRVPILLRVPALVHGLSCEPLLGPITLRSTLKKGEPTTVRTWLEWNQRVSDGRFWSKTYTRLGWVIVGGESGAKARPQHPDWARDLRDECEAARVPFHYKQHGEWVGEGDGDIGQYGDRAVGAYQAALAGEKRPDVHRWPEEDSIVGSGGYISLRVGTKVAGRVLDGRVWDEFPDAASLVEANGSNGAGR